MLTQQARVNAKEEVREVYRGPVYWTDMLAKFVLHKTWKLITKISVTW